MHVLLSYSCVLTVVKYTDMLCYVMLHTDGEYSARSSSEEETGARHTRSDAVSSPASLFPAAR